MGRRVAEHFANVVKGGMVNSLVVMGLSAYLVAKHQENKIIIAHLCLSIIVVVIFTPLLLLSLRDEIRETRQPCSALLFILLTCIWFILLIVLVADPRSRQLAGKEGREYFNQTTTQGLGEAAGKIALGSGPHLGIIIVDSLNILLNFGSVIVACSSSSVRL